MTSLEKELIKEMDKLGVSLNKLPNGAKPLPMKGYYFLDVKGKRIIYETIGTSIAVRRIIPICPNIY